MVSGVPTCAALPAGHPTTAVQRAAGPACAHPVLWQEVLCNRVFHVGPQHGVRDSPLALTLVQALQADGSVCCPVSATGTFLGSVLQSLPGTRLRFAVPLGRRLVAALQYGLGSFGQAIRWVLPPVMHEHCSG